VPGTKLEPWDEIEEGIPDRRRVFAVRSDVVQSRLSGKRYTVDRLLGPDWVNVVAVTADQQLVLVRQWRFGARAFTLELPAGIMEPGEAPLAAGLRELREETGYAPARPDEARVIGKVMPNPAFMGNSCHTVFVPGVAIAGAQALDPMEEVEVVTMPLAELDERMQRGELATALGMVALTWWRLAGRPPG
jgi:ADP-ribose pyrophosphatase